MQYSRFDANGNVGLVNNGGNGNTGLPIPGTLIDDSSLLLNQAAAAAAAAASAAGGNIWNKNNKMTRSTSLFAGKYADLFLLIVNLKSLKMV